MPSFARWNRRYHLIEIDLPGSPVPRNLSIDVKFNGANIIKRLMIDRYSSSNDTITPVKSFCSCPEGTTTQVLQAGASGSCAGITGPAKDVEPDMIILTPGFRQGDCQGMGAFLPFDFWQMRETYFVEEPGGTNRETSVWEITEPTTNDSIIITIVIEDNAGGGPASGNTRT